jgi:hypothetical protein
MVVLPALNGLEKGKEEASSIESGMCPDKAEPGMALAAATDCC